MVETTHLIFTHGGGRLANQLVSHAHLLAFCAEQNGRFTLNNTALSLWQEQLATPPCFPNPLPAQKLSALFCKAIATSRNSKAGHHASIRLLYRLAALLPNVGRIGTADLTGRLRVNATILPSLDLGSPTCIKLLGRYKTQLICGWQVRSWQLVQRHKDLVRASLEPTPDIKVSAFRMISSLRARCDFIIGVHIRRGDYRTYLDGRLFYPVERYVQWMRQAQQRFADRGRIGFLVASDEQPDPGLFAGIDITMAWQTEPALPLRDCFALGLSDIILAPPSTFAFWAAFCGLIPLIPLTDPELDLRTAPMIADSFFDWLEHPLSEIMRWR